MSPRVEGLPLRLTSVRVHEKLETDPFGGFNSTHKEGLRCAFRTVYVLPDAPHEGTRLLEHYTRGLPITLPVGIGGSEVSVHIREHEVFGVDLDSRYEVEVVL